MVMNTLSLETIEMIFAILVAIGTVVTMGIMAIKWMVKHYLGEIKQELKPNGGGSLKDQVNRLENRMDKNDTLRKETYVKVEKLERKIDDLYDKFIEYLSRQNNK